jgi:hypothetical protein
MCVAVPAGILAAASLASTVVGVVGAGVSMAASAAASQAKIRTLEYQQKQDQILAQDALKRGAAEAAAKRREVQALEGRQRAVMAAAGLDLGSGSPLTILADTAQFGELDVQTIKSNADREARHHTENARLAGMGMEDARTEGFFGVLSAGVQGASLVADKWYRPAVSTASTRKYGNW